MSNCKLENCRLSDDVAEIKAKQQETHDTTLRMVVAQESLVDKFDEYMSINDEQHKTFFDRTRWGVTWKALGLTTAGILGALGTIFKLMGVW